jgi:hypothetical protein
VQQLQLELAYINQAGINVDAGCASNDNILDVIDIAAGDANLANNAVQNGVTGEPAALTGIAHKFHDDQAQTNFWANFIAQSNTLGNKAMALVNSSNTAGIKALIADLQAFQKNIANFDMAQGGIFSARFDNETSNHSTTTAEVADMIKGLMGGNAALVQAAAMEMHANAANVGGNNIPITGGAYNADGTTVAQVLSTAVAATTSTGGMGTGTTGMGEGTGTGAGAGAGAGASAGAGATAATAATAVCRDHWM